MSGTRGQLRVAACLQNPTQDDETHSSLYIDGSNHPWQTILPGDSLDHEPFLTLAGVLVLAALSVADEPGSPAPGSKKGRLCRSAASRTDPLAACDAVLAACETGPDGRGERRSSANPARRIQLSPEG